MKKLVKGVIITAAACIILGSGLCITGRMLGGEPGFWIRNDGFYTNQDIKKERAGRMAVLEKTELDAFGSMDIRVDYNHIVVKPSDDDRYYLEYRLYTRKNDPEYYVKDGVLNLTCMMNQNESGLSGNAGFFVIDAGGSYETGQATVYVPKNVPMDRVKLYNADGQITYDGPEAKTLNLTSNYGGILLENPTAEQAFFSLSDGSLTCEDGTFTNLTLTNKYGNTNLTRISAADIDIQISDGRLTMEQITTGTLTAENKYGRTRCSTITADVLSVRQSDGTCIFQNADIKNGRFENEYGNMNLDLTGAEKDYNFDLNMKYGDITLNGQKYEERDIHINNGAARTISTGSNDGHVKIQTK